MVKTQVLQFIFMWVIWLTCSSKNCRGFSKKKNCPAAKKFEQSKLLGMQPNILLRPISPLVNNTKTICTGKKANSQTTLPHFRPNQTAGSGECGNFWNVTRTAQAASATIAFMWAVWQQTQQQEWAKHCWHKYTDIIITFIHNMVHCSEKSEEVDWRLTVSAS